MKYALQNDPEIQSQAERESEIRRRNIWKNVQYRDGTEPMRRDTSRWILRIIIMLVVIAIEITLVIMTVKNLESDWISNKILLEDFLH